MPNNEHTRPAPTDRGSFRRIARGWALESARRLLVPSVGLCLVAMLWGCAGTGQQAPIGGWDWTGPVPDGYYLIRQGDTLSSLAARRGVGLKTLASWNGLESPYSIYAGRLLRVEPPDGRPPPRPTQAPRVAATGVAAASSPAAVRAPTPTSAPMSAPVQPSGEARPAPSERSDPRAASSSSPASGLPWAWPLGGSVVRKFNAGDRTRQGIRIRGRPGEQVTAAADGKVVYSGGGLTGYGNLIIVKHSDTYLSAYGFNRTLLVEEGARVRRGEAIAEVGEAIGGGGYLLHFEIRREGTAVDPLRYLPPRK
jgi:lipoprotein NlpD